MDRNGHVTATFLVAGLDEIGAWIRSFGTWATVLEPAPLRARLRDEAAVLLQRYSEGQKLAPARTHRAGEPRSSRRAGWAPAWSIRIPSFGTAPRRGLYSRWALT